MSEVLDVERVCVRAYVFVCGGRTIAVSAMQNAPTRTKSNFAIIPVELRQAIDRFFLVETELYYIILLPVLVLLLLRFSLLVRRIRRQSSQKSIQSVLSLARHISCFPSFWPFDYESHFFGTRVTFLRSPAYLEAQATESEIVGRSYAGRTTVSLAAAHFSLSVAFCTCARAHRRSGQSKKSGQKDGDCDKALCAPRLATYMLEPSTTLDR